MNEYIQCMRPKSTVLSNWQEQLLQGLRKQDQNIFCLQDANFQSNDTNRLNVMGMKKYHVETKYQ